MPFQALLLKLGSDDPGDLGLADQETALKTSSARIWWRGALHEPLNG